MNGKQLEGDGMATDPQATEPIATSEDLGSNPVMMSQADYAKIAQAMVTYKDIEMKYLASRQQAMVAKRVVVTFIVADLLLFFALWLAWLPWEEAAGWAIAAFAAQEIVMGLLTFIGTLRAP